jgi:hypothetical protein
MSYRFGTKEEVLRNRERFLSQLEIPLTSCVALKVQHKTELIVVDHTFSGQGMKDYKGAISADGLITKEKGLYLFLLIADCLPIIFFDPNQEVVAVVHSGWKSTDARMAFKTVNKLVKEFNCNAANIYVAIGPAIHKESYRFKDPTQKQSGSWRPFLEKLPNGETAIDLVGYNKKQLKDAGISPQNIFVSNIDTVNSDFFSYYRDSRKHPKDQGRFVCVAGISV